MSREDVIKKFTAKVPLKRLARVEDVVVVTLFLASEGADYNDRPGNQRYRRQRDALKAKV